MTHSSFLPVGAILAFFAIAFGAFGAHGLKDTLTAEQLSVFQTAVDYHMWHAIGLTLIGLMPSPKKSRLLLASGWFMFAGIVLFSGSLYALSLSGISLFGAITPIGGLSFLIAWALLASTSINFN